MPEQTQEEKKGALEADISIGGISLTQKIVFARYLAIMLKSGLSISEALDIIHDQATGKFKKVVMSILKAVQAGNTLSDSLKHHSKVFSNLFVSTAFAGESSGTLDDNLANLAEQLKKEKELKSKIKSAMLYPVIVLVGTFVLGMAMAFLVIPKITPLFEGMDMELPITTKILIGFSNIVQDNGMALLGGIILGLGFFIWLLRRKFVHPVTHWLLLRIPIVKKISQNSNLANFCRTLGMLLKSGLTIDAALNITKETSTNFYYKKSIARVSQKIAQGTKLSDNLSQFDTYFPKIVTSMVRVGERSGNLEDTLFFLADFHENEVDNSTKALSTAIEPILLIIIGLVVGGMAISIVAPIYQITGNIQK
jgi:type IV pilus assembly protein PilC